MTSKQLEAAIATRQHEASILTEALKIMGHHEQHQAQKAMSTRMKTAIGLRSTNGNGNGHVEGFQPARDGLIWQNAFAYLSAQPKHRARLKEIQTALNVESSSSILSAMSGHKDLFKRTAPGTYMLRKHAALPPKEGAETIVISGHEVAVPKRPGMSTQARERISKAQKKRWREHKKAGNTGRLA